MLVWSAKTDITFSTETLRNVVRDIAKNVARNGAKHIVLMIAHEGIWRSWPMFATG